MIVTSLLLLALGAATTARAQPAQETALASRHLGAEAFGSDGKRLGVVDNFLVRSDGVIAAALINVKGFMGLVECSMAVPREKLQWTDDMRRVRISMTKVEFETLPVWDPKNSGDLRLLSK